MKVFRYYFTSEEMKIIEAYESEGFNSVLEENDFNILIDYYIYKSQFDKALNIAQKAIDLFQNSLALKLRKAQILLKNKKPQQALEIIETLEKTDPKLKNLQIIKAYTLTALDKANIAFEIISIEIAKIEDDYERSSLIGEVTFFFTINSKFNYALDIQKAEFEKTGSPEWLLDMAYSAQNMQNYQQAIKYQTQFLDERPFSEEGWLALARANSHLENYNEACEAYEYALAIDPKMDEAKFEKGICLLRTKRFEETIETFSEYLVSNEPSQTEEADIHLFLGIAYSHENKLHEAYKHLEKAFSLGLKESIIFQYIGKILSENNQKDDALFFLIQGMPSFILNDATIDFELDSISMYFDIQYQRGNYSDAERIMLSALWQEIVFFEWSSKLALLQAKHLNKHNQAIQTLFNAIDNEDNQDQKPYEMLATCMLMRDYQNQRADIPAIIMLLKQAEKQGEKKFATLRNEFPEYREIPEIVEFLASRNIF